MSHERDDLIMRRKGFTLLELMMVSTVVILAGSIIVPRWTNLVRAWDLDAETRKMAAQVRTVQQMALSRQQNYGIRMNLGLSDRCYDVGTVQLTPFYLFTPTEQVCLKNDVIISTATSSTITIATDSVVLYFDDLGTPHVMDSGGAFQFAECVYHLQDIKGNKLGVEVEPSGGRVRIKSFVVMS